MSGPQVDDRAERSRRYPAISLREAINSLELLHRGVGLTGGSRETLAQAIGHTTLNGTSKRKIAALLQYGLIEKEGERYKVSDLGRRIIIPVSEQEKIEAIAEAARRPTLFQEIGSAFDQQPIPSMLANVLAREYGVLPQASAEVANLFVQTVDQAGLIVDGVLAWNGERSPSASADSPSAEPRLRGMNAMGSNAPTLPLEESLHSGPYQDYSIPLDNRGRKALIHLPTPVTTHDLSRLRGWVAYMQGVISDEDPAPAAQ